MKITSLALVGYKRMALNDVNAFTIKPVEPTQLILGTNGSGKSSLIGELTPVLPNTNDFLSGGSKTIVITHRGSNYTLTSIFSNSNTHSFIKDGEELNPGHKSNSMKELIFQHFNTNAEIHTLLSGRERFCDMPPSRRREWFTKLSDVSYDYALAVYKKLTTRERDLSGALKLAKKRLVSESTKVISAEEESKLTQEIGQLSVELNFFQQQRSPLERPVAEYEQELKAGLEELTRSSMRLLRMRFVAPYGHHPSQCVVRNEWYEIYRPGFNNIEEIQVLLDEYRGKIASTEALINKAVGEHSKIKETLKILLKRGEDGLVVLAKRREGYEELRALEFASVQLGLQGLPAAEAMRALESVGELLSATFVSLPENQDKRYSTARKQEEEAKLLTVRDARQKRAAHLLYLASQRQHMESHKSNDALECPKCNHRWVHGYSDAGYQKLLEIIADEEVLQREQDATIKDLESGVAKIDEYGELYRDYVRTTRHWPVLQPFWDHLQTSGMISAAPRQILTVIEQFKEDLRHGIEIDRLNAEIRNVQELIASSEQVGDASLWGTKLQLEEIELHMQELTAELTRTQSAHNDYSHYRRQLQEATELGARIEEQRRTLTKTNDDMVEMLRRETINHCIKQLQHSLVRKEETLSQITMQKVIISELTQQISDLDVAYQGAGALVKGLSPSDGLIAEGLLGFIRNFTGQMNTLIRKIWSYPLQIQDCGVSESGTADLDYKFPMMVQSKTNIKGDVSEGSTGMQEIMNLAFKVVAMRYLDLAESPLYLDEFGSAMDVAHKTAASLVIKQLIEQQPFTQLFMVSHDYGQYGSIANMEVCVLCQNNITVPSAYNHHVVMS